MLGFGPEPTHRFPKSFRRIIVTLGVICIPLVAGGVARADGPATSWTSASAGQQTLDVYQTLTSSQKASVIYTVTPPSMPSPGGTPIYQFSDWTTTGTSASEFEAAASEVLTTGKIIGRLLPALRLLGTIGLGLTAFDIGWRFSTGQDFWSDVRGSDTNHQATESGYTVRTPQWHYYQNGLGYGFTSPGWYLQFNVVGYGSAFFYPIGTKPGLQRNGLGLQAVLLLRKIRRAQFFCIAAGIQCDAFPLRH
jgi:hypothetical protein